MIPVLTLPLEEQWVHRRINELTEIVRGLYERDRIREEQVSHLKITVTESDQQIKTIRDTLDDWWEVFDESVERVNELGRDLSRTRGHLTNLTEEINIKMQKLNKRVESLESQIDEITTGIQQLQI